MLEKRDIKALYTFYLYNQQRKPNFNLSKAQVQKILDYVDAYPVDKAQLKHRQLKDNEKLKFVLQYEEKTTLNKKQFPSSIR